MKKLLLLFTFLLLLSSFVLVSCKQEDSEGEDAPLIPSGTVVLNVYNWGEYISDGSLGTLDVNAAFEEYYYEKTGVRVKVNYYYSLGLYDPKAQGRGYALCLRSCKQY